MTVASPNACGRPDAEREYPFSFGQIPPAKAIRPNIQWPALGAGGAAPIAPARYAAILFSHPSGRPEAPRANLPPRRIRRLKSVIPRPDEWAYSVNSPSKVAFDITTGVYFSGRISVYVLST